jgi:ribose-phosphate pyrophosphokinase
LAARRAHAIIGHDARHATVIPATRVHAFPDSEGFGRRLARATGSGCTSLAIHRFPDGESLIRVRRPVGRHALLVRSLHDPNPKLVEVLLAADALRRAGARRVTLVAPYLGYMRQDAVFRCGEPISQRVMGEMLGRGFDGVVTLQAHLHRTTRLGDVVAGRARSVSAAPALAAWVRRAGRGCMVVGPDEESESWVRAIARAADVPWVIGRKERLGDRRVRIRFPPLPAARRAAVVDDIASSGGTLAEAARVLHARGIRTVDALVVHPLFGAGALARVRAAGVRRLVSCDTVPHPTNAIPIARLLAAALR